LEGKAKNEVKSRKVFIKLILIASSLTVVTIGTIVLWIAKGIWIPFAIWLPLETLLSVLLAWYHYKDISFVCAACNSEFKPPFKKVLFTCGTPKARWLTCTKCGHEGYCAEAHGKKRYEI